MSGNGDILVLGHSFVKRLDKELKYGEDRFINNFGLVGQEVTLVGIGGLTLDRLKREFKNGLRFHLEKVEPSVLIVQLGGNDLCSSSVDAVSLASEFIEFFGCLRDRYNIAKVYICEKFGVTIESVRHPVECCSFHGFRVRVGLGLRVSLG